MTSIRIGRTEGGTDGGGAVRAGGPGIKWPKEEEEEEGQSGAERRGEEEDKLPIKWVSGIWDAIAYRVRTLISDTPRSFVSTNIYLITML